MKRFLVFTLVVLFASFAVPVMAQWNGVYPEELAGVQLEGQVEFWAVPLVVRHAPWSFSGFPNPPVFGYVGNARLDNDGEMVFTLTGMVSIYGRQFSPPPGQYGTGEKFDWDVECGCYLAFEKEGNPRNKFEAWVAYADDEGVVVGGRWVTGCFRNTGSYFPWWGESPTCVWVEFDLIDIPEWKMSRVTRRVVPSK